MKNKAFKAAVAVTVNLILITLLVVYLASGTDRLALSLLLPCAVHISLNGSLLYFLYRDRDIIL